MKGLVPFLTVVCLGLGRVNFAESDTLSSIVNWEQLSERTQMVVETADIAKAKKHQAEDALRLDSSTTNALDSILTSVVQAPLPVEVELSQFVETLTTISRAGSVYYVIEGDMLYDAAAVGKYYLAQRFRTTAVSRPKGLVTDQRDDRIVRWKQGKILSYCVRRNTFNSQSNYEAARDSCRLAAEDWESACGIRFDYQGDLDEMDFDGVPDNLVFVVEGAEFDTKDKVLAAAFFPSDPPLNRIITFFPCSFTSTIGLIGIAKHEFGHVLGFRHEHIRPDAGQDCLDQFPEDSDGIRIIGAPAIDPESVMHYKCGNKIGRSFVITTQDRESAVIVYGRPLRDFLEIE